MSGAARWTMPGRIEVLGKHTDYGGGRVLVCAVDRGVTVHAERVDGPTGALQASTDAYPGTLRLAAGSAPDLPGGRADRGRRTPALA